MNRADSGTQADDLPGFLDEGDDATTDQATAASDASTENDGPTDATSESQASAEDQRDDAESTGHVEPTRRAVLAGASSGGGLPIALGCALLLSAIGLGFGGTGAVLAQLERFGLSPTSLVIAGAVLVGLGSTRARITALHRRFDEADGTGNDDLQATLQALIAGQQTSAARQPTIGEDQQQLLVALQRQDEKIVNLTKALKMYGKPIMEIAAQGTELAGGMAQAKATADATLEASRQAWSRIEAQLRTGTVTKQTVDELHEAMRKVATAVESAANRPAATVSFEPLQQQMTRTEVAVQAVAQRLEDSEVRKSLMRLEDTAQKSGEAVQQLLRGETVEKAATKLEGRLDHAAAKLHEGLTQMRDGNLGGLATSVRDIQREVASVATGVAQIQAMVKSGGGRVAAATPTPSAAPVAAPPAPSAAPTAGTPASPSPTACATAPTGTAAADAGAGAYQTGARTSNSKNVLGAIAKLKQMKG